LELSARSKVRWSGPCAPRGPRAGYARWPGSRSGRGPSAPAPEEIAARLLQLERLTDAIAEGEFVDMGMTDSAARRLLAEILAELRS